MLPKLPLDLSTFRILREKGYLYVDKTQYAYNLITGGRSYFLSRPRRFGKSLFVSTLKEILTGEKRLFEGLWIAKTDYAWKKHGIIALDLSSLGIKDVATFDSNICRELTEIAKKYDIIIPADLKQPELVLRNLVKTLHDKFGEVAILIDEYDNPILNLLSEPEKAKAVRDSLKHFFAAIKGLDAYLSFVFITGVSSFTKAGLFSGINNLQTITLNDRYAGICGYTEQEIADYFDPYIRAWAESKNISEEELYAKIKSWYNGYHFGDAMVAVYNPFSFMRALSAQSFKSFWIQSGTPTFLIEEFKREYSQQGNIIVDPEGMEVTEDILQAFDVGAIPLPALMFQAGYLTITSYDAEHELYSLGYPNHEVERAFKGYLIEIFTHLDVLTVQQLAVKLRSALSKGDVEELLSILKQLFSRVTYYEHEGTESYYHTTLQNIFSLGGIDAQSQFTTSHGRADIVLTLPNRLYIIEVKLNRSAESALQQIKDSRYYEAFLSQGKPIILLGIAFARKAKQFDITCVYEEIASGQS